MEVEAHEKKGHRAFAKAIKSLGSHRRSNCDLDKMCGKDALYASDKTFVQPKQVEGVKTKVKSDLSKEAQPARGAQSSLRKEILQLEKHLKDQQVMRGALEKALGPDAAPVNNLLHENSMPGNKPVRTVFIWLYRRERDVPYAPATRFLKIIRRCLDEVREDVLLMPYHKEQHYNDKMVCRRDDCNKLNLEVIERDPYITGILADRPFPERKPS
ncbi:hypothetical protein ZWY2020_002504 [Hordeum vulgare]|nr:hypothetical protein ZWY2020_002504 [Hordeum vulgare]